MASTHQLAYAAVSEEESYGHEQRFPAMVHSIADVVVAASIVGFAVRVGLKVRNPLQPSSFFIFKYI